MVLFCFCVIYSVMCLSDYSRQDNTNLRLAVNDDLIIMIKGYIISSFH